MKAYIFIGMIGSQRAITGDETGANLPTHPTSEWIFDRAVDDITSGTVFTAEGYEAFITRGYWISPQH